MSNSFISVLTTDEFDIDVVRGNIGTRVIAKLVPGFELYLTLEDAEKLRDQLAACIAEVKTGVTA